MNNIRYVLLTIAVIFFLIPVFLYFWINGSWERYLWIISGPPPYCYFGSVSYQLKIYLIFVGLGLVSLLIAWLIGRKKLNKQ